MSEWWPERRKPLYNKTVEDTEVIARALRGQRHGQVLALLTRLKQTAPSRPGPERGERGRRIPWSFSQGSGWRKSSMRY